MSLGARFSMDVWVINAKSDRFELWSEEPVIAQADVATGPPGSSIIDQGPSPNPLPKGAKRGSSGTATPMSTCTSGTSTATTPTSVTWTTYRLATSIKTSSPVAGPCPRCEDDGRLQLGRRKLVRLFETYQTASSGRCRAEGPCTASSKEPKTHQTRYRGRRSWTRTTDTDRTLPALLAEVPDTVSTTLRFRIARRRIEAGIVKYTVPRESP